MLGSEEEFEKLKEQFISDTERHLAHIRNLSFEEVDKNKTGFVLTVLRSKLVNSSAELSAFINNKRLQHFYDKIKRLKTG